MIVEHKIVTIYLDILLEIILSEVTLDLFVMILLIHPILSEYILNVKLVQIFGTSWDIL